MKTKVLYIFTLILIAAFPFGNQIFKVIRGVSVFFFHHFEKTASFAVHHPPLFERHIHFYLTDFWIIGLLIGAFLLKEIRAKELFFNRHSRYLTLFSCVAVFSILFSLFSTYFFQYITLINLMIAFSAFHLIYILMSKKKEWIPIALWFFVGVATLECLIGTGQFLFQKSLGLSFLSEVQTNPSMHNISVYPLTEGNRALFDKLPWIGENHSHVLRAYGTFGSPNIFGGYLVTALFVSYFLFMQSDNRLKKSFLLMLIPLLVLTLVLTFARGPFFAWILGTFLFFGVGLVKKMKGFLKLGLMLGGAFFFVMLLLFQQLAARGGFVNYNALSKASDGGRLLYYKLAATLFAHYPFLGIGHNGFALFPYEVIDPTLAQANRLGALAHNMYLQVACETGIIGLGMLALFIFSLVIPTFKQKMTPLSLTLITILFSLLLMGVVDHFLWAYNAGRLMLLIFCALLAAYTKARECPSLSHAK